MVVMSTRTDKSDKIRYTEEKPSMSQKGLIFIALTLFLLSSGFLFWKNKASLDPGADQGWWALSFEKPHDPADLSFSIDNRTRASLFRYEIRQENDLLSQGEVQVGQGETKSVPLSLSAEPDKRTFIIVTREQTIYR
jgi:hypothetical protein